jgi:hypothetical protein
MGVAVGKACSISSLRLRREGVEVWRAERALAEQQGALSKLETFVRTRGPRLGR